MRYAARVDANQKEIVNVLRNEGAYVMHLHQLKNLFDILVAYKGKLYAVEIKQIGGKLTKGEAECKKSLEQVGGKYHVVFSVQDALDMLNGNYIK